MIFDIVISVYDKNGLLVSFHTGQVSNLVTESEARAITELVLADGVRAVFTVHMPGDCEVLKGFVFEVAPDVN